MATAGSEGLVELWSASPATLLAQLACGAAASSVAWSPDGTRFAVATDADAQLSDVLPTR